MTSAGLATFQATNDLDVVLRVETLACADKSNEYRMLD
jgi:hypothetical protein